MLDRLARFLDRRRRPVLIAAVAVVFAAGAYGGQVVRLLDVGDDFSDPDSESIQARDTIEKTTGRSAAPDAVVLVRLGAPARSAEAQRRLRRVTSRIKGPDVARIDPSPQVSKDGRSTYVLATFADGVDDDAAGDALVQRLAPEPGVTVGGGQIAFNQVGDQVESDLRRAEILAGPILLLFSLLVFRSLV